MLGMFQIIDRLWRFYLTVLLRTTPYNIKVVDKCASLYGWRDHVFKSWMEDKVGVLYCTAIFEGGMVIFSKRFT